MGDELDGLLKEGGGLKLKFHLKIGPPTACAKCVARRH